jgi:hypothetical protein
MTPAFSSSRQAAAFALLLALLLALPALVAPTGWLKRRDVYPSIPSKYGPFSWIQQQIFTETNAVDIAFLGSSLIWSGVNTPFVQRRLSEQLRREAEVFTLGWPWPGYDPLYFIARDLLDQRRVRMLVIYDEYRGSDMPHLHSSRWFRLGENSEALDGLPWPAQAGLYGGAVLGMPRHLLSLVRSNLLEDPAHSGANIWNTFYRAPNVAEHRGALCARIGFDYLQNFTPYQPLLVATPGDVVVYSADTRGAFTFTGPRTPPYQSHFARKLAQLCRERGTRLVVLHLPELRECDQAAIPEREPWPEVWSAPVDLVGIPGAKLFAGIPVTDLKKFYYDPRHLNQNGQEMFTRLLTPVLLKLYATSLNRF